MGCEVPSQWSQLRCRRPLLAFNGTGCPARRGEASLQETSTEMSDDLEVWQSACEDSADSNVSLMMFHPDHEQFEEDEQELEEIWNKSVCSNIMDTNYKKQLAKPSTEIQDFNPMKTARKLYTTSAPNLFVPTELRLHSTSSQAKQDLKDKGTSGREMAGQNPNATRRSWAPDTHHAQTSQMASLYNETTSVMAMTPSVTEEKYVYRYGEEEETSSQKESEQTVSQLSICVSDRVAENVSTLLHSARSNWAVAEPSEIHPATRRHCGHTLEPSTDKSSPSEHCPNSTWDVQCPSQTSSQTMEGTLERKHILQVGGKKASCRTWNTFHTLLFRKTLLFYKDRKDTIKSSMAAAPLNLSGVVCTPATDYLKKTNSFRLQ
ncbi:spectrin beta chain, non-erythrocytic 1-like [Heterodontus francisci]|uniref:spectrin beta chain, non-erythrocytic 1-like n=1 Tax=Heterodontus francisci TaxID=7792 RepID=UPI00355B07BA